MYERLREFVEEHFKWFLFIQLSLQLITMILFILCTYTSIACNKLFHLSTLHFKLALTDSCWLSFLPLLTHHSSHFWIYITTRYLKRYQTKTTPCSRCYYQVHKVLDGECVYGFSMTLFVYGQNRILWFIYFSDDDCSALTMHNLTPKTHLKWLV